jgi:hypothetical protein
MAFSIKFTEGVCPGKKLQTLKRSAEEIYDASAFVTYFTCSADLYAQKQRSQLLLENDKALIIKTTLLF